MIQINKQSLSESEKDTLIAWLGAPGAEIFLKVIRAERAVTQIESGMYFASRNRGDEQMRKENMEKAAYLADRTDELIFLLDKFHAMRSEGYKFYTATINP